jgi:glutaredoxin
MDLDTFYQVAPQAQDNTVLVVFSMDSCANCKRAKMMYDLKHVPYVEINVSHNQQAMDYVLSTDLMSMPLSILHDKSGKVEINSGNLSKPFLEKVTAAQYTDPNANTPFAKFPPGYDYPKQPESLEQSQLTVQPQVQAQILRR